jgi:tRNA (cytidine/uridine-2'-O-)-methyltransferase
MLHIVLYEPEIPQNTGNIARLCAATGAVLDLIEPLGFFLEDPKLKRAGLDYWNEVTIRQHQSWTAFQAAYPKAVCWYFSTKGRSNHSSPAYGQEDFLVFGPETRGLPAGILAADPEHGVRIPMRQGARSLNLANTVAIAVYEAMRQSGFPGLS